MSKSKTANYGSFHTYYGYSKFPDMYLDWLNNYITVDTFADHYNMTSEHAAQIIAVGRATDNFTKSIVWEDLYTERTTNE